MFTDYSTQETLNIMFSWSSFEIENILNSDDEAEETLDSSMAGK